MAPGICTEDPGGWRGSQIWRRGLGGNNPLHWFHSSLRSDLEVSSRVQEREGREAAKKNSFFPLLGVGVGARRSLALAWWKLRIFSTDLLPRAREPEGSTCQCPMPLLLPPAAPWLGPIADIFSDTLTDSGGQWQRLTRPKWEAEDKENAADSTRAERNTAQWKRECR
jgi:hypothetical protein